MDTNSILLHELTREELRNLAPEALLVLPLGATEQHGPHLPAGTDALIVEHVARAAAAEAGNQISILVAPTMPFGSSHHHLPFGATMSLGTETFYRAIYDLGESLVSDGFRRMFILNGHGGNDDLIRLVARDLALKHPVSIATASYWTIAWEALVKAGAHEGAGLPGHAGAFETSLIMALRPDLVREPRPHRDETPDADSRGLNIPYRSEAHGSWQGINGYSDSPDRATAERGQMCLEGLVSAVAGAFVEFYFSAADTQSSSA